EGETLQLTEPTKSVVMNQLKAIAQLRCSVGIHSKMAAVATAVKTIIEQGEKVLIFCHFHATAQELTSYLASVLPTASILQSPEISVWRKAWDELLVPASERRGDKSLRSVFIEWLCTDLVRSQTWNWLCAARKAEIQIANALRTTRCRHNLASETIEEAA